LLTNDLEIYFLELEKVKKLKRQPQDPLEAWLMYLNKLEGEEMEAIAMANPAIRRALTIEEAFKRSEQERRLYELREKALRDEISMMDGARAEGKLEGKAEGKVEMAREAICQYLDARFGRASRGLQKQVSQYNNLQVLNKIINQIYTAASMEDARTIIERVAGEGND
jgi:hypothetical protein